MQTHTHLESLKNICNLFMNKHTHTLTLESVVKFMLNSSLIQENYNL